MVYKKKGMVDLHFTIYYHISQGLNPTQIAKKYNWKYDRIMHYIRDLKQYKLIKKVGYGTWETTEKQLGEYHKDGGNFSQLFKVRGHGFQFKLIMPKIEKWDDRIKILTKNHLQFTLVGNKGSIVRIIHKNHKIWLCNKSIIVYYPRDMSFFNKTAKRSRTDAIYHFKEIIESLERLFRISFKINKEYLFSIPKRHYALINNEFAKNYLKQGKTIEIRSRKGDLWALIDNSHNLEELELVHPVTAEKDTDRVIEPFMNLLRENPKIMQELITNISLNTRIIKAMQDEIVGITKLIKD